MLLGTKKCYLVLLYTQLFIPVFQDRHDGFRLQNSASDVSFPQATTGGVHLGLQGSAIEQMLHAILIATSDNQPRIYQKHQAILSTILHVSLNSINHNSA
jgi:hypothetical protein